MTSRRLSTPAWVAAIVFGTIGCQTVATDLDQPARITDANDASRDDLRSTVSAALGVKVTLSDDALTSTSLLVIERNAQGQIDSEPTRGRIMDVPIQFHLVINGSDCVLVDQRDESRHLLENTSCVAE